ncbi:DUF2846 domain-containing protein [Histophilus somni]|uniref:DUF2846 domain-containing protein n=2 Tax=Histophilus somni TaxID=731 RepID=UPI00201EB9A9|nr:DUF2846 domain-containing protein [Histophilus somni]
MKFFSTLLLTITLGLTGCARTVMDTPENDALAKQFLLPSKDESGIYIYRDSIFGAALKKNLYIDGKLIGESAPKTYFYKRVIPGNHRLSTESEFSDNHLDITTDGGKNYFIRQYIKPGVFVGGANLKQVDEDKGKATILKLKRALAQ